MLQTYFILVKSCCFFWFGLKVSKELLKEKKKIKASFGFCSAVHKVAADSVAVSLPKKKEYKPVS